MTDDNNSNNTSGWVSASGHAAGSGSSLQGNSIAQTPQTTVGQGGLEITGNGPVRRDASASYTSGQDAPVDGSIMATVTAPGGSPIGDRNPRGSDMVTIGGMETSIAAAVKAKLLVRNHDGQYSDPVAPQVLKDPVAEAKPQAPAEKAPEDRPQGVSFGEAADATMQEFLAGQNPGDLFKMVDSVLHRGNLDEATIGRMASTAGDEPEAMREKIEGVWQGAYDAGMDVMAEAGVENEEAFEAFMADNPRLASSMIEAARNYFVYHKPEGLVAMAESYLPQMDRYETDRVQDLLTAAGYQFEAKPEGGLHVIVNGSKISWDVAVKQRVITFSQEED